MQLNKIYQGDSLKLIDLLDQSPKLVVMSPPDLSETPYNFFEYKDFLAEIYVKCFNKMDQNGVLISITTDRKMDGHIYTKHIDIINSGIGILFNYKIWCKTLKTNLYIPTFAHILCFKKSGSKITNNKISEFFPDVLLIKRDNVKGYKNKDSFPTELVELMIKQFTNISDLVFDPFIGTGKTAIVAKKLSRKYIGFELEPKYVEICEKALM